MNKERIIIVVEDDPDLGQLIRLMLEYKNYSVRLAVSGVEAEKLIHAGNADLVIMDMLLSGTSGIDICKKLRQNPATSGIRVMMTSAYPDGKQRCLEAGADDFISKPFDMDELLLKVDRLVAGSRD